MRSVISGSVFSRSSCLATKRESQRGVMIEPNTIRSLWSFGPALVLDRSFPLQCLGPPPRWGNPGRGQALERSSRKDWITLSAKEKREDADSVSWRRFLFEGRLRAQFRSLANLVSRLAPASDVSIDAIEFGQRTRAVTAGDWLTLSGAELADRVSPAGRIKDQERQIAEEFMRPIHNQDGKIVGRAALYPSQYRLERPGALVLAGLRVTGLPDFLGVVPGDVATAARDKGRVVLPPETVSKWATEQVKLIEASDLAQNTRHYALRLLFEAAAQYWVCL